LSPVREPADGWLERDGISLHYLEWTPDPGSLPGPPILLLHGLSSNAHYWDRVAQHLANRRLVALDQRGHGLTGRPPRTPHVPEGFAMEQLVADAELVIDRLGLERPLIAGHSWGATVGLELTAHLGDSASALVFIDGPLQSAANLFSWEEAQRFMQPPLPRYSSFGQAIEDSRRDFAGAWADDLEPFVMSRVMQQGSAFVLTLTAPVRLELLRGLFESPVDQLWAMLAVPAAALLARQGPAAMAARREGGARMLAQTVPHVDVKWFDTPHDIPLYQPEAIAAEIARLSESEPAAAQELQQ
jgi:pimeloyl-ACP methyl ester carboxylesterase